MADLRAELTDVVIRLDLAEALLAGRRQLRVPLSALRMVHVEEEPMRDIALLRFPGLCWPGSFAVGTARRGRLREFAAVRAGRPAVVLDIEGGAWDRVVVSVPNAVGTAAELAALLLGRNPGRPGQRGRLPITPQD